MKYEIKIKKIFEVLVAVRTDNDKYVLEIDCEKHKLIEDFRYIVTKRMNSARFITEDNNKYIIKRNPLDPKARTIGFSVYENMGKGAHSAAGLARLSVGYKTNRMHAQTSVFSCLYGDESPNKDKSIVRADGTPYKNYITGERKRILDARGNPTPSLPYLPKAADWITGVPTGTSLTNKTITGFPLKIKLDSNFKYDGYKSSVLYGQNLMVRPSNAYITNVTVV